MTVDGASVRERSPEGVLVDLTLTLINNNTAEIVLGELEYTVTDETTFSGRRRAQLTLAPLTTETLVIPAVLVSGEEGAAPSVESLRVDGRVGWRGTADLERALYSSGLYRPRVGFNGTVAPKG